MVSSRSIFVLAGLTLVLNLLPVVQSAEPISLPSVGALVRVEASRLGPGWHLGIFNRLRVEPPCYRVVIFAKDGSNRITHTLRVEEVERMQSHLLYNGREKVEPPRVLTGDKVSENWAEVSVNALWATAEQCPS